MIADLQVYEYTTNTPTDEIHLVRQPTNKPHAERTLCGLARFIRDDWTIGDETYSGLEATCGSCVNIIQREQPF